MVASLPVSHWSHKHALITGASSGIGAALARELGAAGCKVTLVARRADRLTALADELSVDALALPCDLSCPDPAVAIELVAQSQAALGPIDVLVNNAGMQRVAAVASDDTPEARDAVERLLTLNLLAPLRLSRALLPQMVARGAGCVVDVSSVAALAGPPGMAAYAASKAGLAAHSEAMRAELAPHGVHVLTVYPGPIHTDMAVVTMQGYGNTPARHLIPVGTSQKLAQLIRRAIEKRRDRVIYPIAYAVTRHMSQGVTRFALDRFTSTER